VVNTLKFFINGTGLEAIQAEGDSTAIYLLNDIKGKNTITVTAFDQGKSMNREVILSNSVLKVYILNGELQVEEAEAFPGEEPTTGIKGIDELHIDDSRLIYDLQGRRLSVHSISLVPSLSKGVYLVAGKKIVSN
jgi:hypothetical protein